MSDNPIQPKDEGLLKDIQSSIMNMQSEMQSAYQKLSEANIEDTCKNESIKIILTATYQLVDLKIEQKAFQGGIKEFIWRMREAWKTVLEAVQKTTQMKTMELLQGMSIPDEIKNMSLPTDEDGEGGEGVTGGLVGIITNKDQTDS